MQVRVSIVRRGRELWLELDGGSPAGKDTVHTTVSGWAGWKRCPQLGTHNGQPCSRYQARAWLAALQPLLSSEWAVAWAPDARAWADEEIESYRRRTIALGRKVTNHGEWQPSPTGRVPMIHQVQALGALTEMGGAALLKDDMGLGKTSTALLDWAASPPRRALVICPKSVKLNWQEEVELTFGCNHPRIFLLDGTSANRANIIGFMQATIDEGAQAIAIVNYDLLAAMNERAWTTLERWVNCQAVIADEFHYCKDRNSKRAKAVAALMGAASYRLGLTGTPVRNTVEDLFSLVEILRPGTWVSYHDFANRHLVVSSVKFGAKRQVNVVRGGKNLDELARVMSTLSIGRKKDEVLTLPPMIRSKPRLELDGLHLDVYKAMKTFARVELERLTSPTHTSLSMAPVLGLGPEDYEPVDLSIFHPLARSGVEAAMRCEMIAQGFLSGLPELYAEQIAPLIAGKAERIEGYPNAFMFPDSPKIAWLLEAVENDLKDRPVVILSRFNAPIMWLQKRLDAAILIGSMDAVARQESLQSFRKGERRVICVQAKLAEGFNLTNSTDLITIGRDWAPAINEQGYARVHRIGTTGTVNVQIPIVHNTVERFIDKKLDAKDADSMQALATVTLRELLEAL